MTDIEKKILEFFNRASAPAEIVNKIPDDPDYGSSSPRAYGVRISLAKTILSIRNEKYEGKFTHIEQIDRIQGIGKDTLHDIEHLAGSAGGRSGDAPRCAGSVTEQR